MAAGAGWGMSASPACPWGGLSVQGRENGRGKPCSPREEASGELTVEGKVAAKRFDDGGGSGGAPAGGDPSSKRHTILVTAFPRQKASREANDRIQERKG
jgi:hypothetical protein